MKSSSSGTATAVRICAVAAAAASAIGLLHCGRVLAFDPLPPEPVHITITDAASSAFGFSGAMAKSLWQSVVVVDIDEQTVEVERTGFTFSYKTVVKPAYVEAHHFDRGQDIANADAFKAGAMRVRDSVDLAVTKAMAGDGAAAISAIGAALHALQDFHSHSNLIDLAAGDQTKALEAVWDGTKAAPVALQLTAFFKAAEIPGKPPGDAYPHDDFNKDNSTANAEAKMVVGGTTKFQLARDLAIASSKDLLSRVRDRVGIVKWSDLIGNPLGDFPLESRYRFRHLAVCDAGPCAVGGSGTTVAFAAGTFSEPTEAGVLGVPFDFFHDAHGLQAPDGAGMAVIRELRAGDSSIIPAAEMEIGFSVADLLATDGSVAFDLGRLRVYFADPAQAAWVPVSGALVDYDAVLQTGVARFDVTRGGVYAVGAPMVPEPSAVALSAFLGAALLTVRRRAVKGTRKGSELLN